MAETLVTTVRDTLFGPQILCDIPHCLRIIAGFTGNAENFNCVTDKYNKSAQTSLFNALKELKLLEKCSVDNPTYQLANYITSIADEVNRQDGYRGGLNIMLKEASAKFDLLSTGSQVEIGDNASAGGISPPVK